MELGKKGLVCLIILLAVISSLEITARLIFPEYKGNIHTPKISWGFNTYYYDFEGRKIRAPYPNYSLGELKGKSIFVVLGQSVINGYGTPYEDIFWVKFQRLMSLLSGSPLNILPVIDYGSPVRDMETAIRTLSKEIVGSGASLSHVLYQFGFAHIKPFNQTRMKALWKENIKYHPLRRKFTEFRYKYLHRSVLFHLMASYGRGFFHKRSGTCEERGIDALGNYTWTFGSRKFKEESEMLWGIFEQTLIKVNKFANENNFNFSISISPTLFDIDNVGAHPRYNFRNLDFSCATINPRGRLNVISSKYQIDIIDPSDYLKKSFELRLRENNFQPYFALADTAHFTPLASTYIAEYLIKHFMKKIDPDKF